MELIEKILFLQKILKDTSKPDSTTNDTYLFDDSLEEQTINDMSFNDFSIMRDTINTRVNYGCNFNNKAFFNEDDLYENKIIKIQPYEINEFAAKFIKSNKRQKK